MSEEGLKRSGRRRLPAILVALTIGVAGVAWAGCGDDDENGGADAGEVQNQIEQGVEEATEGVEKGLEEARQGAEEGEDRAREGVEKGKEEAEEGVEKGKEEAQKGIEEGEELEDRYAP
jgi:hypothetical protein